MRLQMRLEMHLALVRCSRKRMSHVWSTASNFIVMDFHHLLLAGLPAHCPSYDYFT